jgi:hypothetical protein
MITVGKATMFNNLIILLALAEDISVRFKKLFSSTLSNLNSSLKSVENLTEQGS